MFCPESYDHDGDDGESVKKGIFFPSSPGSRLSGGGKALDFRGNPVASRRRESLTGRVWELSCRELDLLDLFRESPTGTAREPVTPSSQLFGQRERRVQTFGTQPGVIFAARGQNSNGGENRFFDHLGGSLTPP